jgi:hypothetical protein
MHYHSNLALITAPSSPIMWSKQVSKIIDCKPKLHPCFWCNSYTKHGGTLRKCHWDITDPFLVHLQWKTCSHVFASVQNNLQHDVHTNSLLYLWHPLDFDIQSAVVVPLTPGVNIWLIRRCQSTRIGRQKSSESLLLWLELTNLAALSSIITKLQLLAMLCVNIFELTYIYCQLT